MTRGAAAMWRFIDASWSASRGYAPIRRRQLATCIAYALWTGHRGLR